MGYTLKSTKGQALCQAPISFKSWNHAVYSDHRGIEVINNKKIARKSLNAWKIIYFLLTHRSRITTMEIENQSRLNGN